MAPRFTPVADPEKARCEQDEESLRKHRQFDTPFALLPSNLNEKKKTSHEDMHPLGRPSGELEQDDKGLWRKKVELFEKPQTWGRETVEYSNPEQARAEGNTGPKWGRPGVVGWGVQGKFGGRGNDSGLSVTQRGEVNQSMEKNEKGLWVRKTAPTAPDAKGQEPASEGHWRCRQCGKETVVALEFCRNEYCGGERPAGVNDVAYRSSNPNEDPRLEAAKKKGRGTEDAAKQALKSLAMRRRDEQDSKEKLGLMRRAQGAGNCERGSRAATTLNSRAQQVRPAPRLGGVQRWQGVQRSDEDAKKIVGKAVGGNVEASGAPLRVEDSDRSSKRRKPRVDEDDGGDLAARIAASVSRSRSRSRSRSLSRSRARQKRSRSPASSPDDLGGSSEVVVDFF